MLSAKILQRDPTLIPAVPGIYAVFSAETRQVYVSYSSNMQACSYGFAAELVRGRCSRLGVTPVSNPTDYTFKVVQILERNARDPGDAAKEQALMDARAMFESTQYELLGPRGRDQHRVELDGRPMTITGAMSHLRASGHDKLPSYNTVWQRLERNFTSAQALGLEPPPPRWGKRYGNRNRSAPAPGTSTEPPQGAEQADAETPGRHGQQGTAVQCTGPAPVERDHGRGPGDPGDAGPGDDGPAAPDKPQA